MVLFQRANLEEARLGGQNPPSALEKKQLYGLARIARLIGYMNTLLKMWCFIMPNIVVFPW